MILGADQRVVSHRGRLDRVDERRASAAAPDNSLAAFREAIAIGVKAVELDVRRTSDRQLVVFHDRRVRARRLGPGALLADITYAQLRALRPEVPLLAEVMGLCAGRARVDVEIKEAGYEDEVLEVLAGYQPDASFITSFSATIVATVKRRRPSIHAGLLVSGHPMRQLASFTRRVNRAAAACQADIIVPHDHIATPTFVECASRHGLAVLPWAVTHPGRLLDRLLDPQLIGVITDQARTALEFERVHAPPKSHSPGSESA